MPPAPARHLHPNVQPRLLGRRAAAEYCGVSPNHFDAHCDVRPVRLGGRLLWDRLRLDDWIERMQAGEASSDDPLMEALENAGGAR